MYYSQPKKVTFIFFLCFILTVVSIAHNSEGTVVSTTNSPITKKLLISDLRNLGLAAGDSVIVHSSLSKMGWVVGAAQTVIEALMEVVTEDGTIVMPTHTSANSDPANWQHPPVPQDWWDIIRNETPGFNPNITPTRGMGCIPELFRIYPNVVRSAHPQQSFAAWGKNATVVTENHALTPSFGEKSPLAKNYHLRGKILLLGVDHGNNTSLHYAEVKAVLPHFPIEHQGASILQEGKNHWISFTDLAYDDDDFRQIGESFETFIHYTPKKVGNASARLLSAYDLINYAVQWIKDHRRYPAS